ncbi:unnamed protein product [Prunus armeniaca]
MDGSSLAAWLLRIPPCGLVKRSSDWIVLPLVHDDGVRYKRLIDSLESVVQQRTPWIGRCGKGIGETWDFGMRFVDGGCLVFAEFLVELMAASFGGPAVLRLFS